MLVQPRHNLPGGFRREIIGFPAPLRDVFHLPIRLALIVFIKATAGKSLARHAVVDERGCMISMRLEDLRERQECSRRSIGRPAATSR